jgi:hypothetical protein
MVAEAVMCVLVIIAAAIVILGNIFAKDNQEYCEICGRAAVCIELEVSKGPHCRVCRRCAGIEFKSGACP